MGGWLGNAGGVRVRVSGTLLGPEGSGTVPPACARRVVCAGGGCGVWFFWVWALPGRRCCRRWLVGCRLLVENFTVDASIFVAQVGKGTRWMPWYQEPKKDVGICDKPRVVDNRTVIRGFPNGVTRLEASPVTRA